MIYAYQNYDLLDCKKAAANAANENGDQYHSLMVEGLLNGPRKVLEYTMTFVNALASECLGRSYLLQKPDLVELLVNMLHME